MPLEAVMICVDNSDYTRNGDYTPTRFESQTGAVNLVCSAKTQQNPENSVGILTTAGDRIEVMITPTSDLGKMVSELAKINIGGSSDLLRAIQTAQLALKHRQNKNQKQRIIAFVGSPVVASDKELETLGKNLKKNNVSIDLVSFGEVEENAAKLQKLLTAVNSNETSHMLEVPVGPKLLSDVLLSSVIISPDGEAGGAAGLGGEAGFEFGINPNDDPELALALRISMEEERARQQQHDNASAPVAQGAAGAAGEGASVGAPVPVEVPAASVGGGPTAANALPMATDAAVMEAMGMEDMDEELRQALLLSLQEAEPMETAAGDAPAPPSAVVVTSPNPVEPVAQLPLVEKDVHMGEVQQPSEAAAAAAAAGDSEGAGEGKEQDVPAGEDFGATVDSRWFQDPSFVQELLGSLPGVDINDPRIQMALHEVGGEQKDGDSTGGNGDDTTKGSSGGSGGSK